MQRRDFLRRGSVALAGGLLFGDAELEALEMLTHRKVWAGHTFVAPNAVTFTALMDEYARLTIKRMQLQLHEQYCGHLVVFDRRVPVGTVVVAAPFGLARQPVRLVNLS